MLADIGDSPESPTTLPSQSTRLELAPDASRTERGQMRTKLTEMAGCEYPIVAFSHCRDVIVAVTNAGGFGMFGAAGYDPDELDVELKWIDDRIGGKGYGIDVLIPL